MVVAIATVHSAYGFFMNWSGTQKGEGFEYHLLVLALTVFLMVRGGLSLSIARARQSLPHIAGSQVWFARGR
jgi:putative oxidoreductase